MEAHGVIVMEIAATVFFASYLLLFIAELGRRFT